MFRVAVRVTAVESDDRPSWVNGVGPRVTRVWGIEGGKDIVGAAQEAVRHPCGVKITSRDGPRRVDAVGLGGIIGARGVDRGESPVEGA